MSKASQGGDNSEWRGLWKMGSPFPFRKGSEHPFQ